MVGEAFSEIFWITVLCLLPLIGIALSTYLHQATLAPQRGAAAIPWHSFWDFLTDNLIKGQLAFYAISNWATVVWLCGRDYRNLFPWRIVLIVFCVFGFYFCGVLIDPSLVPARAQGAVLALSTILYLASMLCYFVVALYGKIPAPSAEDTNTEETETLREKLKSLRDRLG